MLTYYLIVAAHVLVCIILILVVLLQSGKGADLAGAFGGGATQTAFGSRGPASVLSKITTGAAVVFMLTSITLATIHPGKKEESILDTAPSTAPQPKAPAVQPSAPPPTPEEIKRLQQEIEEKQKQSPAGATPQSQGTEPSAPGVRIEVKPPSNSGQASPPSGNKP